MHSPSTSRCTRTIAVVNQKGGCGKTTTAINLAAVLARGGDRTLLVDMDPQSHCATGLGIPESRVEFGLAQALSMPADQLDADGLLWEVSRNLWLAPSTVELAAFEATALGSERDRRLERLLERIGGGFHWCVIDCPPTIGLLTFNALRACDEVIVPVETGYFALRGAERQVATVQAVGARLGRELPIRLLPSMHREGTKVAQEVLAAVTRRFPELVIPVVVREHEVLREAASFGQAIVEYAPESPAHEDFRTLVQWLRQHAPMPRAAWRGNGMVQEAAGEGNADHAAIQHAGTRIAALQHAVGEDAGAGQPRMIEPQSSTRAAELAERMRRGSVPLAAESSAAMQHEIEPPR